ncbi:hypothetical protein B7463_g6514, partial [Scytalidium lignicola]
MTSRWYFKDLTASNPAIASPHPTSPSQLTNNNSNKTTAAASPEDISKRPTTNKHSHSKPSVSSSTLPESVSARDRKRALDRKAQRASREKTRARIAHLENLVKTLSEGHNDASTVRELLAEIDQLNAEGERLKKVIKDIRGVVDEFEESLGPRRSFSDRVRHSFRSSNYDNNNNEKLTERIDGATSKKENDDSCPMETDHAWIGDEDQSPAEEMDTSTSEPRTMFNVEYMPAEQWARYIIGDSLGAQIPQQENNRFLQQPPQSHTGGAPLRYTDLVTAPFRRIYGQIFAEPPPVRKAAAEAASAGSIIKFVKDGWEGLSAAEKSNPLLKIMKEVDENLFWDLDPVIKVANLYKSHVLLKYYFNKVNKYLEQVPEWQRPVYSQNTKPHPVLIDFFPWPEFRDYLMTYHNYYSSCSELSIAYRQHLKFRWPFSFSEAYTYDPVTREYALSPLFEQYFRDPRNWGMQRRFFELFPVFKGKMSVYEEDDLQDYANAFLGEEIGEGERERSGLDLDGRDTSFEEILITGATGYIGGSVLSTLLSSSRGYTSSHSISALVRDEDKAKVLIEKGVKPILFKSLDESEVLKKAASEHDVVIHTASGFHTESARSLILGLAERKKQTRNEVYYIHTSGTSNLGDQPITGAYIETCVFTDKENTYAYLKERESKQVYAQRTTDIVVVETGLATGVKTHIIMSPTIYGPGRGLFNRLSIQIPTVIRASIRDGVTGVIGEGKEQWDYVHIDDLIPLYELILSKIISGNESEIPFGERGIIFSATGVFSWRELSQGVADALFKLGVIKTSELKSLTLEQAQESWTKGPLLATELGFASRSRTEAVVGRELGWKPVKTHEDFKKTFEVDARIVLEEGKK